MMAILGPSRVFAAKASAIKPSLEALNKAIGQEDYPEAKRQAEAILRGGKPEDQKTASLLYGRILLSLGQKAQVPQYLAIMARQNPDANVRQWMEVYQAWLTALSGKPDEAVATLEAVLKKNQPFISTAEAADVLAILRLQQNKPAEAARAVDLGLKFLKYQDAKTGYLKTLLQNRLGGKAKRLFDEAEKLRAQGKLAKAGNIYVQLRLANPKSQYAHPAGYRIGQCLSDLGRTRAAEEHLQKFVEQLPSGPWRGQAQMALIDLFLKDGLDLQKADGHSTAATAILAKGVDEAAKGSWNAAALGIHLRHGAIRLTQGQREPAALAFEKAKQAAGGGSVKLIEGLNRLIHVAREQVPLLPEQVDRDDDRAKSALSIAGVFHVACQYDHAQAVLKPVLKGRSRSRSRLHRSFAALALARVSKKLDQPEVAHRNYLASLRECPDALWHDQTLRELGLLIEQTARPRAIEKLTAKTKPSSGKNKDKTAGGSIHLPRHDLARELAKLRAEALPYWIKLFDRFPSSPLVPEALYHAGVLYSKGDQPKAEKALEAFERLTNDFPDSPWTGDAHVWLVDVKIERQFDLAAAQEHVEDAIDWLEYLDREKLAKAREATDQATGFRSLRQVSYDIYMRAGLLQYLNQKGARIE